MLGAFSRKYHLSAKKLKWLCVLLGKIGKISENATHAIWLITYHKADGSYIFHHITRIKLHSSEVVHTYLLRSIAVLWSRQKDLLCEGGLMSWRDSFFSRKMTLQCHLWTGIFSTDMLNCVRAYRGYCWCAQYTYAIEMITKLEARYNWN